MKIDKRQLKVHLLFSGALLAILLYGLVSRMAAGERFLQAAWGSVREIRPFEWFMIIMLWYVIASKKSRDSFWYDPPTTLGSADRKTG